MISLPYCAVSFFVDAVCVASVAPAVGIGALHCVLRVIIQAVHIVLGVEVEMGLYFVEVAFNVVVNKFLNSVFWKIIINIRSNLLDKRLLIGFFSTVSSACVYQAPTATAIIEHQITQRLASF